MYAGHAAIALALKARFPRTPLLPLAVACYGPDWVDVAMMIPRPRSGMAVYSHSIPSVVLGAAIAALLFEAVSKRPGALVIAAGWISHWFADLMTGRKPVISLDTMIGLDLYHLAPVDFVLESLLVIGVCVYFAKRFARTKRTRLCVAALACGLITAQMCVDLEIARGDTRSWTPTLAFSRPIRQIGQQAGAA